MLFRSAQALLESQRVDAALLDDIARSTTPAEAEEALADVSVATVAAVAADGGDEFLLLHSLRIKGFAAPDLVAEITCIELDTVKGLLPALAERGLARHIAARDLWQLTPDGRTRHAELLLGVSGSEVEGLREHYERFLELNDEFKALCARWQTKGSDANDHTDLDYDNARITELRNLHDNAVPVVEGFAGSKIGRAHV